MMRRALEIILRFNHTTNTRHPHSQDAVMAYAALLLQTGHRQSEVIEQLNTIGKPLGIQFGADNDCSFE